MKGMRSYRSVCVVLSFLILMGLSACAFDQSGASGKAISRAEGVEMLQAVVQKGDGGVDLDLQDFDLLMDVARKKSRIELKWKNAYSKMVETGQIDLIESFVFKYLVDVPKVDNPSNDSDYFHVPWRTEVAPSAKTFMTDVKITSHKAFTIKIFARFKDHVGPNKYLSNEMGFIIPKDDYYDPDDAYDKSLWYLGTKSTSTIDSRGSNILGNYGYDIRKGGSEFNPGGLVPGAFLDSIALFGDSSDAIEVKTVGGTKWDHHEVTSNSVAEFAQNVSESSKWDLSWMTAAPKGNYPGVDSISKAISSIGATKGADGKVVTSDLAGGTANAIVGILNSTITSVLGFFTGSSSSSSSNSTKSAHSSVAGELTVEKFVNKETINRKYWSYEAIKPFLNAYFKKDVDDVNIAPETLFNKYGTHMPFEIIRGGRMHVQYFTESGNSSTTKELKDAAVLFTEGKDSSSNKTTSYLNNNAKLSVHTYGGSGANSMVSKLSDYYKAAVKWLETVDSKSAVVIDCPGLLEGTGAGAMAPIWNFAEEDERKNEIRLALARYVLEDSYDVNSLIYGQPRYLQDIIFCKLDTNPNSLSNATNRFNDELCNGRWKHDGFSKSIYKDDASSIELSDSFAFCKTMELNGKPLPFGSGVYGMAVYSYDKDKALKGVAITRVDGSASDKAEVAFESHSRELIESFPLLDAQIDANNLSVGNWRMCDCAGYGSDVRIWKSKDEGSYPISSISLCFSKGKESEGWEDICMVSGEKAKIEGEVVSIRREKVI